MEESSEMSTRQRRNDKAMEEVGSRVFWGVMIAIIVSAVVVVIGTLGATGYLISR